MPRKFTVVTTFNQQGLQLYGQRFINSFAQNMPAEVDLYAYGERSKPIVPKSKSVIYAVDQEKYAPACFEFKKKYANDPRANGQGPDKKRLDAKKAFKWDAIRFANKTYAVFDACDKGKDWVVWMDADSYIHSPWSYEDFIALLPEDKWLTYVGRGKGSQTWPECGFYGMNLNHPICSLFLVEFERMYEDAENGMFKLEEWHDSYIFGEILNRTLAANTNVLDYSADMYLKEAKTGGGGHPLINGPLGKFMDHMKGGRKDTGKSLQKDLMVNRTEDYWKS